MGKSRSASQAVAVTGIGAITCLGTGIEENWRRLTGGESGIHAITRFATEGLRTSIAGTVDFVEQDPITIPSLCYSMADSVLQEALVQSGLEEGSDFPGDLFVAAPPIEHDWVSRSYLAQNISAGENSPYSRRPITDPNRSTFDGHENFLNGTIGEKLAEKYGCTGSPITLTTACASGASAIQLGVEAIRRGDVPAALCVGTDGSIIEETLIRFSLLSALSSKNEEPTKASRPFSKNRDGFVMAEGAAALVLESAEHAEARGAEILAYVRGCGEATDTFHRTRSNPDGKAIVQSMMRAVEDAGLTPEDIHYINAHGTSTPENDKMEHFGISEVFGDHKKKMAASSNKSMIGHSLTAAGAVEAAFSIMTLREGVLPPTINYEVPDPTIEMDVVPNEARKQDVDFVLSNSFGFGGQNVSLVFGREA